jgi:hypothetical protein
VRRPVRTAVQFWAALDVAMPVGREPSWHDFAAIDLPDIVERFAVGWDDLPALISGRADYRILIGAGRVVAFYAVDAQLASDGSIELVGVEIDVEPTGLDELGLRGARPALPRGG